MTRVLFLLVPPGSELPTDSMQDVTQSDIHKADLIIGVKSESINSGGRFLHPARIYKIRDNLSFGQAWVEKQQIGKVETGELDPSGLRAAADELNGTDSHHDEHTLNRTRAIVRAYLDALG